MSSVAPAADLTEQGGLAEDRGAVLFRRLMIAMVGLGLAVLLAASALTVLLVSDSQKSTRWVNHTYNVEQQISSIRVSVERAEAARRGFLITRAPLYLSVYQEAVSRITSVEGALAILTADNPRQQTAIAHLAVLVTRKLDEEAGSMRTATRTNPGLMESAEVVLGDQATLAQMRDVLSGMVGEEKRLLALRTAAQSADASELLAAVLASAGLLALLAVAAFLLVRRYAADLDRSQHALKRLNAGLEQEVRRRTADLTRANEEIQRFAYIVSHDLRSPLVNVMGFTSELETAAKPLRELVARLKVEQPALLSRGAQEAVEIDLPESLGFIRSSTQKMDRLINAILRLSREGRRNLTPEAVDMDAVVEGIIASLKQQTDAKGASIAVEGDLPDLVNDRLAVEQVFSNVVENALKYLKPGRQGEIRIRGQAQGATHTFEVQDNGRGIAPADQERVFELFRRAGAQDQPGEGIGLAHVRALVYRLGGTITVDSELDRGSTFRICLPAAIAPPSQSPSEERP